VEVSTCDYLLDLDFPRHPVESPLEPRYAVDTAHWERVVCRPFLDARHSPLLTRTLWLPGQRWWEMNEYGDYCLLRSTALENGKIKEGKERIERDKAAAAGKIA
jgi:alpha-1,2-mannosyltransferase